MSTTSERALQVLIENEPLCTEFARLDECLARDGFVVDADTLEAYLEGINELVASGKLSEETLQGLKEGVLGRAVAGAATGGLVGGVPGAVVGAGLGAAAPLIGAGIRSAYNLYRGGKRLVQRYQTHKAQSEVEKLQHQAELQRLARKKERLQQRLNAGQPPQGSPPDAAAPEAPAVPAVPAAPLRGSARPAPIIAPRDSQGASAPKRKVPQRSRTVRSALTKAQELAAKGDPASQARATKLLDYGQERLQKVNARAARMPKLMAAIAAQKAAAGTPKAEAVLDALAMQLMSLNEFLLAEGVEIDQTVETPAEYLEAVQHFLDDYEVSGDFGMQLESKLGRTAALLEDYAVLVESSAA